MTRLCDGSGEIDIPSRYVRHAAPEDCDPPGYWSEPCPRCEACECDVCDGTGQCEQTIDTPVCCGTPDYITEKKIDNCPECEGTGRKGGG